jgi:OmpR-family two-component system manganese-sensing sensor histidine kinase
LLFASGFYLYVRSTLIERVDDTLNHVVEVVQRSLVIEIPDLNVDLPQLNLEASFRNNADAVEDDHIDLEWFDPTGELLWTTFSQPLSLPLHVSEGETVHITPEQWLRQVTRRIETGQQVLGYLRVSHPWFEVTKPSHQLIRDLSLGTALMVGIVAAIGWLLSELAMAPIRDSYQRLKQFTADASHELRNPIAVIQTNVQVALADPDPQLQQQQLKVLERLTRRLGRLVDDLLFLARQDSGITPLKMHDVALDELLVEVVEEQKAIAFDKSIYLSLSFETPNFATQNESDDQMYCIQGDRDQLIRLFTNLISNAVQYTLPQGEVQIMLKQIKSHGINQIQARVTDTGIGIPSESIPHIFDRFYRVDPARSHSGFSREGNDKPGSGLGLAIAKVIVENHQGQIQIESEVGKGTSVTVALPQIANI